MTYVAAHAVGIAALLLLFQATGLLIVRAVRAFDGVDPTGLVPIALGIGAWMYWLFALAALGLYRPWVFIASALVVLVIALLRRARPSTRSGRAGAVPAARWILALGWIAPA